MTGPRSATSVAKVAVPPSTLYPLQIISRITVLGNV